jgi:hypothetical protein
MCLGWLNWLWVGSGLGGLVRVGLVGNLGARFGVGMIGFELHLLADSRFLMLGS